MEGRRHCQALAMPVMPVRPALEVKVAAANHSPSGLPNWNKTTRGSRAALLPNKSRVPGLPGCECLRQGRAVDFLCAILFCHLCSQ